MAALAATRPAPAIKATVVTVWRSRDPLGPAAAYRSSRAAKPGAFGGVVGGRPGGRSRRSSVRCTVTPLSASARRHPVRVVGLVATAAARTRRGAAGTLARDL